MSQTGRFANLLGHTRTAEALSRALDENRVSPALLFHGPAGVGKLTAAVELARHLLCPNGSARACGLCDPCRRMSASALLHPDVGLLFPQKKEDSSEKSGGEAPIRAPDLHAIQEEVRRNPTWRILADPARERLRELFLSPSGGRRRLLLVLSAERLQEESGNALLKVLEEPPSAAAIILLCENPSALLATIRSRCQSFRFGTLSRKDISGFLGRGPGPSPDEAGLIASLSGGRIGRALSLTRDVAIYRERRARLSRILEEARRQKTAAAALAAAGEIQTQEHEAQEDLAILADLLRDIMLKGCGCNPDLLTDPTSASPGGSSAFSAAEASSLLVRLERTREDLRRYVNRQLALESLFLDLANPPPSLEGVE